MLGDVRVHARTVESVGTFGQLGDDDASILGDVAVLLVRRSEVHRPQRRVLHTTSHGRKVTTTIATTKSNKAHTHTER